MTVPEFLEYCRTHADTPRCGFVPAQIARLYRLGGDDILARAWERQSNRVVDCDPDWIMSLVNNARLNLYCAGLKLPDDGPRTAANGYE